ncbi:hypothetical protein ACFQX7_40280 [Luedemannella flava]
MHALVNLAFLSTFLGMPRQSLRYADAAEGIAGGRTAVVPRIRQATAYALAGERTASHKAITKARASLEAVKEEAADWYSFVDHAELDGIEGTVALLLGDPRRAERLLLQAIAKYGDSFARNRALYRVRLAKARLDLGEVEGAAISAGKALDDLSSAVASHVIRAELSTVARRLGMFSGVPGVDLFMGRHADIN